MKDVFTNFIDHNQMVKDFAPNSMLYMRFNCTEYFLFGHSKRYLQFTFDCGVVESVETFFSNDGIADFLSKFKHPYDVEELQIINI